MKVGTLQVRLIVREARTLKDKRQVVRSVLDRLKNAFNVAVAEVDQHDNPKYTTLGFAVVGNESEPLFKALNDIANALRAHPVAEFVDSDIDVRNAED